MGNATNIGLVEIGSHVLGSDSKPYDSGDTLSQWAYGNFYRGALRDTMTCRQELPAQLLEDMTSTTTDGPISI